MVHAAARTALPANKGPAHAGRGTTRPALKRIEYPVALRDLITQLRQMPGVGPRSAERIALWMVQAGEQKPEAIARAIAETRAAINPCAQCGFFATADLCEICSDESRARELLCVVEQPTDILPLEKTGAFRGRYHSLGGRISPLDRVAPEDLRIALLLERVEKELPNEVIFALAADVEGEATTSYLVELLKNYPVTLSRIAHGLPAGGGLESADELTLYQALSGRTKF
jgi:recombination protein RecR